MPRQAELRSAKRSSIASSAQLDWKRTMHAMIRLLFPDLSHEG
jgi:hypothetical protein